MTFRPRTRKQQLAAIGIRNNGLLEHMEAYPKEQRRNPEFLRDLRMLLRPHPEFFPSIPTPDPEDWLGTRKGTDQTFFAFTKNHGHRRPRRSGYRTKKIYLVPIVENEADLTKFPPLDLLESMVASFFCLEVIMLDPLSMKDINQDSKPIETCKKYLGGHRWKQYDARGILRCLEKRKPSDAQALMAFTMHDLFKVGFNYLFGLGSTSGVGVFSFFRQDPASVACEFWNGRNERMEGDDEVLIRRASMTLCHEICHILGMKHCTFYSCLMQGANSLEEAEKRGGLRLCPCCLRKLCWSVAVSPKTHYEKLLEHCACWPGAFADDIEWLASRISLLTADERALLLPLVNGFA